MLAGALGQYLAAAVVLTAAVAAIAVGTGLVAPSGVLVPELIVYLVLGAALFLALALQALFYGNVPVLLGLFCEVNAGVLAAAYAATGAHWATAYWDQAYAEERRPVTPVEQQVHSVLEMSPVTAAFLLTALHWDQALALAGHESSRPRFAIRLKRRDPLTASARAGLLTAIALLGVLPYAEELLRCWYSEDNFQRQERANELARKKGVEPINIALAYVLGQSFEAFALVGPRHISETVSTFGGLSVHLTPEEIRWLNLET